MKPVIKKQNHYSLLLMSDDTEARTYRVHGRWLRVFFWFLFLLAAGGAAGIAGGLHYWEQARTISARFETQEREANEMRLQLERLVALETVISASNGTIPQAHHAEVMDLPDPSARNATLPAVQGNATTAARNATAPDSAATRFIPASDAHGALSTAAANATPEAPVNATAVGNATLTETGDPLHPQISGVGSPLRVSGFACRATGQQRLRITYELSTEGNEEQRMISGVARYFAVFANGTRLELSSYDTDASRFAITRMKLMQSSARLPQELRASDVEKIDVLIELSEGKTFEERFEVLGPQ